MSKNIWYRQNYDEAIQNRTLDIILEDNPQLALNIVRALVFKRKFQMKISHKLRKCMYGFMDEYISPISVLNDAQIKHYGKIMISKQELYQDIMDIIRSCD